MRTFLKTSLTAVCVTLGCFTSFGAFADLDVYKCKDTQGHLNYTDSPCIGSSKVISHSKVAEHPNQFAAAKVSSERESKAERATAKHKRSSFQSNVNVFAVNEKYNNQVFDEKFKHPRTAELSTLNKNLDKIEVKRQSALKGDL
jgi:hypothetical protein